MTRKGTPVTAGMLGAAAYAYSSGFYHGKRISQPRAQLGHRLKNGRWLSAKRAAMKPQQNHAGRRPTARIHQFAKVSILRDEYALLIQSALQNLLVCRAPGNFGNRDHIMARFAQLSSARKFILQDLPGIGASGSSTTSSWATLAAP
jgi:hypothetical protein